MLNLIGTGLNENSLTAEALEAIRKSDEVYLENYTVDFPYTIEQLAKTTGVEIKPLNRSEIEDESIIEKAKDRNISLLVYGDSLSATTHTQLILACKKAKVEYQIFHNASILTAIAETGLQHYKFGKISSMPTWTDSWKPDSFMDYIKQNHSIKAHSLLLVDIGLKIEDAISQLKEAIKNHNFLPSASVSDSEQSNDEQAKLDNYKIIVCKSLGTKNSQIIYDTLENIKDIESPFCFIIPSELQEMEKEFLGIL
jgi:diphthine synthase